MIRHAYQHGSAIAVAVALLVAPTSPVRAGSVNYTTDIVFQGLLTDMSYATIESQMGSDPTGVVNYSGTFDQTGWGGSLGGTYLGSQVSGSMEAMISGDPNWTVTGAFVNGNMEYGINLSLNQNPNDATQFTLGNSSQVGGWNWSGTLTESIEGTTDRLTGTITATRGSNSFMYNMTIELDLESNTITSTWNRVVNPYRTPRVDMGNYTLEMVGANFNGVLNDAAVATVPEPSSLILGGIAAVAGLGAWARRRKSA